MSNLNYFTPEIEDKNNIINFHKSESDIKNDMSSMAVCPDKLQSIAVAGFEENKHTDTMNYEHVFGVHQQKEKERPFYEMHKNEGVWGRAGVYFYGPEKNSGEPASPQWICSPLDITAKTRDTDSEEWGRLLEWRDPDGIKKVWGMPESLLMGDMSAILAPLASGGLDIGCNTKKLVIAYIGSQNLKQRAYCVAKTGWAAPSVYITPDNVINFSNRDRYIFQSETRSEPKQSKGTLESWRKNVAALCVGNSRLMFAVSSAFAGPILEPGCFAGGGFHFMGSSSIGKSLSMTMAASVIDNPENAVITWRTTDNGLEGIAARHNDGLLMLDELGQVDGRKAGEIAYMLANGTGKARANKDGAARRRSTWRVIFLSNGEIDLATHMESSGQKTKAGQEIRMVTIPADAGKGLGIFEQLHDVSDSKMMADKVKNAALNHYGTAFTPYLKYIAENWSTIVEQSKIMVSAFVEEVTPVNADGQVKRAAERFGLVAYAGDLATKAGITGWGENEAIDAAAVCFDAWLMRRGGAGSHEEAEIINCVRDTITKHASRFELITGSKIQQCKVTNRIGFIDKDNNYLIPVPGFIEMMKGFDDKLAALALCTAGIIKHPIGKNLPRKSLPGFPRCRCYSINMADLPE
nr:DUF927 domain-containing protein [uncultured Tolumonas sp.]